MEEVRFLVFGSSEADRSIALRISELGGVAALVPPPEDVQELRQLIEDYVRSGPGLYLHPGTGHWKRRSELSALAADLGAAVLGPSTHATALWNHALNFLSTLESFQIPNLLVGLYPFHGAGELLKWLKEHEPELPLRIRSVAGRGSFASYLLRSLDDPGLQIFFEQLKLNVSDPLVMIERYREGGRHVRLPFARLSNGSFHAFALQDLSLQYRSRSWLEITPPESVSDETRLILEKRSQDIAAHTDYVGVGALDFILDGTQSYLHQGIPGLTESYQSWEEVSETNAVDWQFAAADMGSPPRAPGHAGCSIHFRITPEDPFRHLVQIGEVVEFETPAGIHMFPQDYDISTGRVSGSHYSDCLKKIREGVSRGWYAGEIQTNERPLLELLAHPLVKAGTIHRDFIEDEFFMDSSISEKILMAAADVCHEISDGLSVARWTSARKKILPDSGRLKWIQKPMRFSWGVKGVLEDLGRVTAYRLAEGLWNVRLHNDFILVRAEKEIPKNPKLYSQISGTIHSVFYREGMEVPAHQSVLLVESQKLLFGLPLPVKVRVQKLRIQAGDAVHIGEDLADLEVIR